MTKNTYENSSKQRQEGGKSFANRDDSRDRRTQDSQDDWAALLATAERYY